MPMFEGDWLYVIAVTLVMAWLKKDAQKKQGRLILAKVCLWTIQMIICLKGDVTSNRHVTQCAKTTTRICHVPDKLLFAHFVSRLKQFKILLPKEIPLTCCDMSVTYPQHVCTMRATCVCVTCPQHGVSWFLRWAIGWIDIDRMFWCG